MHENNTFWGRELVSNEPVNTTKKRYKNGKIQVGFWMSAEV
jgi:hypothetical protein